VPARAWPDRGGQECRIEARRALAANRVRLLLLSESGAGASFAPGWPVLGGCSGSSWATATAAPNSDAQRQQLECAAASHHQLRHAHAVEMAREGVPLIVIQRQLGHSNLGITSVYLQGIDNAEIIETVHARRAPMIPVSASLGLEGAAP
jgi:hypothetical protein